MAKAKMVKVVMLELTTDEACWLKDLLRNAVLREGEVEPADEYRIRQSIFGAIIAAESESL